MNYVYLKTEPKLWTVGHYAPGGEFIPESDHGNPEDAIERVAKLNGFNPDAMILTDQQRLTVYEALDDHLRIKARNFRTPSGAIADTFVDNFMAMAIELGRIKELRDIFKT